MKRLAIATPALMSAVLMSAACARDPNAYPSLQPRPAEKLGFAEPETKPVIVAPDQALDARIAALSAKANGLTSSFTREADAAEKAARSAKGDAVGSEAWLTAQTSLAGLDDRRAQTSSLVTDIDALATDRAARLAPDYPALAALRAKAQAELDRQGARIVAIQAMLPAA